MGTAGAREGVTGKGIGKGGGISAVLLSTARLYTAPALFPPLSESHHTLVGFWLPINPGSARLYL